MKPADWIITLGAALEHDPSKMRKERDNGLFSALYKDAHVSSHYFSPTINPSNTHENTMHS